MSKSETSNKLRPFGMRDKVGYAFGDLANDFTFMLSSGYMLKFYTDVMGISAAVVGVLMMVTRFVDAFTDVTMGQIVDRSKPTKDGKFRPWLKRMCCPVAIASFLIYQSGLANMSYGFKVVWMAVTYILWGSIFYTSVNIPYGSMASAITPDPKERSELSTWRTIGSTLANLCIGVGVPMVAYATVNGAKILSGPRVTIIAGIFSICAIICYLLCFHFTTERVEVPQNTTKLNVGKMLKSVFTNRALLGIIPAALFLLVGMLGMQSMAGYVFPMYYGNNQAQALATLCSAVSILLLCATTAPKLSARFGKRELSIASCLFSAVCFSVCLIVKPASPYGYIVFYVLAYLGLGFFNTLIWAMITDVIDDAEVKNGIREDGTIYSVYSFARKLGQALVSGLVGVLLTMVGYEDYIQFAPWDYPDLMNNIFNLSCLIPAIGLACVTLSLIFIYPLSKKRVAENVQELARRRENK